MQFYSFSKHNGKSIIQFQSQFIMSRVLQTDKETHIGCIYLEENGLIGYHQAVVSQLLLVVGGEGFVRNEKEEYIKVQLGDAVFWDKGEWHETKTEHGLTAIVIEGVELNPSAFMPLQR